VNRAAALDLLQAFRAADPAVNERHIWVPSVFSLWHQIYKRAYDPIALGWEKAQGPRADLGAPLPARAAPPPEVPGCRVVSRAVG
jgi:hypothetical protein